MSARLFQCQTHRAPCQHVRHYPRATATTQEEPLQMEVKQYTPRDNLQGHHGDMTIIATHALGYPKEMYEPLFDELYQSLQNSKDSARIRSIWIADVATSGASAVLNEGKLGNDPSYFDWARDILLMVNHFRDQMPRPLVGMGHSMGTTSLLNTALFHPRLFTTMVMIEPVANRHFRGANFTPIHAIANKRDRWPSKQDAVAWARRHPHLKTFDPRVLQLFLEHGFRELPTLLHPDASATSDGTSAESAQSTKPVTLSITRDHDAGGFARGAYPPPGRPFADVDLNKSKHPDISTAELKTVGKPFYRPELVMTFAQLPFLRPSCLYVYGEKSTFSSSQQHGRVDKLVLTGTGLGGSGGHAEGAVEEVMLNDTGHFCPFERPRDVASAIAPWLERQMESWRESERDPEWESRSVRERSMLDSEWLKWAKECYGPKSRAGADTRETRAKL